MRRAKKTATREMLGKAGGKSWVVRDASGAIVDAFNTEAEAQSSAKDIGGNVAEGPSYLDTVDKLRTAWEDTAERARWSASR